MGRVDRVAPVEGALATVQCWPTATEVVGVPLTDALARTLGMQLCILTGKVTRAEGALWATRWPEVVRMSVPDVVDWYLQEILPRAATMSSSLRDRSWATFGGAPRSSGAGTS